MGYYCKAKKGNNQSGFAIDKHRSSQWKVCKHSSTCLKGPLKVGMGDIENFAYDYYEYHDYCFHYIFTENWLQKCQTNLKCT